MKGNRIFATIPLNLWESEEEWKGGVNVLQPHHGNVPEKQNKEKENQTREDQESDEDSLFRLMIQNYLCIEFGFRNPKCRVLILHSELRTPHYLAKDCPRRDGVPSKKIPDAHPSLPLQLDFFDEKGILSSLYFNKIRAHPNDSPRFSSGPSFPYSSIVDF